jgi:peptidoglycan/xylan/chitin deacetylase (PgdA/CDA1 family)
VKRVVKRAVADGGIWRVLAPVRRRGCIVLTYHHVGLPQERRTLTPIDVFRQQIKWVSGNCEVIAPDDLQARIGRASGRWPAVLITFDDGYRDYHDHAYPILKEFGVPAINFLPTRFLDEGAAFWWDLLENAARASERAEAAVPGTARRISLSADGRQEFTREVKAILKKIAVPERSPILDEALLALGFDRSSVPVERQVMTWDEVRAVRDYTTFGGHTHTHPIMPFLSEPELDREAAACRDRIAAETGAAPRFFAYPSGAFNEAARAAVERAGFSVAFTTVEGFVSRPVDWLTVNRVHARRNVDELAWTLAGWSV